jgi:hypothetical protein
VDRGPVERFEKRATVHCAVAEETRHHSRFSLDLHCVSGPDGDRHASGDYAIAPSIPTEKSARCIEPPLPRFGPLARPKSSAIIASIDAPFARCARGRDGAM